MGALIPILLPLLSGSSVSSALAGITITQWAEIALAIGAAAPKIQAVYASLHPAIDILLSAMQKNLNDGTLKMEAAVKAGAITVDWVRGNAEAAIKVQESMDDRNPA